MTYLVSRQTAADQLSISVRKLDLMIASGQLPVKRIGSRVLISQSFLETFARTGDSTIEGSAPQW